MLFILKPGATGGRGKGVPFWAAAPGPRWCAPAASPRHLHCTGPELLPATCCPAARQVALDYNAGFTGALGALVALAQGGW